LAIGFSSRALLFGVGVWLALNCSIMNIRNFTGLTKHVIIGAIEWFR
jgi:hypothetical protein